MTESRDTNETTAARTPAARTTAARTPANKPARKRREPLALEAKSKRTPTGAPARETPEWELGYQPHNIYHSYVTSDLLGDPSTRIGVLSGSRVVPMSVKLEMLCDWRIALAQARVAAPLISAPWRIACADEQKRAFFEAMWAPLHRSFLELAVMAIPLGRMALIKKLAFAGIEPTTEQRAEGIDPWPSSTTPYIITGFDPIYPRYAKAHFDKSDAFDGIELTLGSLGKRVIPVEFSLWLTRGLAEAFGDYEGMGRLVYCYRRWWDNAFAMDLRTRYVEKWLDPAVKVSYPPGDKTDPASPSSVTKSNKEQAWDVGNAYRSGASIVVPSDTYLNPDGSFSAIKRWDIEVAETPKNMDQFRELISQDTSDILMGYLVPPQALYEARTGGLVGGKSAAEVLSDVVVSMSVLEWQGIIDHVNEYVFRPISEWNFPADSAPAQLVGTGRNGAPEFADDAMAPLLELVMKMAGSPNADFSWLDLREAGKMFGWPMLEAPAVTPQPTEPEPDAATGEPTEPAPPERLSLSLGQRLRLQAPDPAVIDPIQQEFEEHYQAWAGELAVALLTAEEPKRERIIEAALAALALWLRGKLEEYYVAQWLLWARDDSQEAVAALSAALTEAYGYVETSLIPDLRAAIAARLADDAQGTGAYPSLNAALAQGLGAFISRVGMYAGGVWALIDLARRWAVREDDPLCRWAGPQDARNCPGCVDQLNAGERRLSATPPIGSQQCLTNCRHHIEIRGIDY